MSGHPQDLAAVIADHAAHRNSGLLSVIWKRYTEGPYFYYGTPSGMIDPAFSIKSRLPFIDWDEICDDRKFTKLHQSVCDMDSRNLDRIIRTELPNVNLPDSEGLPPLCYAFIQGRRDHMRILLENGARPISDIQFLEEWISSYTTNKSPCLDMDELFLQYIDVNIRISNGMTMLMMLCRTFGTSALHITVFLDHGAEIDLVDDFGKPAVMHCIHSHVSSHLSILCRRGARLDVKNIWDDTILHYTIVYVESPGVIEELRRMDLSMIDLQARNQDGATAFDLLKMRNGLKWKSYQWAISCARECEERGFGYEFGTFDDNDERQIIYGFEALIHEIQDSQAVPKEEQYPLLGGYLSSVVDEELVPGAWPV